MDYKEVIETRYNREHGKSCFTTSFTTKYSFGALQYQ